VISMDDSKIIIKLLKEQQKTLIKLEKKINSLTTGGKQISLGGSTKKTSSTNYSGLTKSIFELISVSFFNTPKSMSEIMTEMKKRAVFHPRTNYPKPLLKLIRDKKLRRLQEKNKWKYVKYG